MGALADPGDPAPALVAVFFLFPKIMTELAGLIPTQKTSKESRRGAGIKASKGVSQ
jgi:hypothetical protein